MAKKKKNPGKGSASKPAQKKEASWPWLVLMGVLLVLVAVMVIIALLPEKQADQAAEVTTEPSEVPGVTAPAVDDSNTTTMRIVKAGSAYVEKKESASTVFSFRKGDLVEVVSMESEWVTIAVEGRGYYLPRGMVRGLDEYVIVLDAGHQLRPDTGKEALGPDGAETETKMDAGCVGVATGQQEYDVDLAVCLKLQEILQQRGYTVMLTRSHNAVNISYVERANVANNLYADAYISLHTGYSSDAQVSGVGAICQTSENSYISDLYADNKELCQNILAAMAEATGAQKLDIQETDDLSGINWCQVPMALVELGYLSNEEEDRLLATEEYVQKLAEGIANGLDTFFAEEDEE